MGDPRKQRKKYDPPLHPWQGERIAEEKVLVDNYGLKNKKEVWKMDSVLRKIKRQTKEILSKKGMAQAEAESKAFIERLSKMSLISPTAKIEDVLDLQLKDILERRLQTQMMRKGLAKTARQARQFIIPGHVLVDGKKMDVPSYLVSKDEEN
ncbi:MAG: 30S ribosomal protein S4, partial [Nanoarchaeota archaeon]